MAAHELLDHDPAGNDRQIGGEATLAAKLAENRKIVVDDGHHHVGDQIVAIGAGKQNRTAVCRMIDHMNDQTHETVDKVFPSPRFFG